MVVNNDRTTTIENDQTEEIRHNQTVMIQNDAELKVGGDATHLAKTLLLQGAKQVTFQVGKSSIVMTGAGIDLKTEQLKVSGKNVTDIRGGQVKLNCAPPVPPVLPENWISCLYRDAKGVPIVGALIEVLLPDGETVVATGTTGKEPVKVALPADVAGCKVRYSKDPKQYVPRRKPRPHGLEGFIDNSRAQMERIAQQLAQLLGEEGDEED